MYRCPLRMHTTHITLHNVSFQGHHTIYIYIYCILMFFQAMVGIAFSLGFLIGPMIGAYFSTKMRDGDEFFVIPALFALLLTLVDIIFLFLCFQETLPVEKRVCRHQKLISPRKLTQV